MSDPEKVVIYRCRKCGVTAGSPGWIHEHVEVEHVGFGPFNLLRNPLTSAAARCIELTEAELATPDTEVDLGTVGGAPPASEGGEAA